jgi:ABC-type nitrate/sulfonate/bicarbonate transport system substrate-binding protein
MLAVKHRSRRRRGVIFLTCALAGALSVSACASGESSSAPGGTQSQSLTVAVGGSSIILADLVVADQKGYFRDQNLDVKLEYLGVPSGQAAIAGNADLAYSTPTQTFSAIAAGRSVQTIWSSTLVNTSLTVAVPENSTAKSIMALSGKSVGTYPVGSASYGDAQFLSDQIVAGGGKPLTIKTFGDDTSIETQLITGRVAAGLASGDFFAGLVAQKKIRILTDTRSFKSSPLYYFVNSGMFGLASTLTEKKAAVQKFITAMVEAAKFITSSPATDVAAVLKDSSQGTYASETTADLVGQLNADDWFLDKSDGCITAQSWQGTLDLAKGFDLPLSGKSLSDPVFSFANGTNLSFLKHAGVTC